MSSFGWFCALALETHSGDGCLNNHNFEGMPSINKSGSFFFKAGHTARINAQPSEPFSVFLIGPSSTGKTHHIQELQESLPAVTKGADVTFHFGIARDFLQKRGITGKDLLNDKKLHMELQEFLVHKYSVLQQDPVKCGSTTTCQNVHMQASTRNIRIFDRSAIDAIVYAKQYGTDQDAMALRAGANFQSCVKLYRNPKSSLVVLFPVIPQLVKSDGMRIHGDVAEQNALFRQYESTMKDLGIPFVVLGTDLKHRGKWLLSRICSGTGHDTGIH